MVDLFNENTLFVLFFAMVAIYNYSALKEYQRMAIIYISTINEQIQNIAQKKDTLCRRMYN